MDKQDFSMMSGVAMRTADVDVIKVCCHAFLFSFNLKINAFVGSSSMWEEKEDFIGLKYVIKLKLDLLMKKLYNTIRYDKDIPIHSSIHSSIHS